MGIIGKIRQHPKITVGFVALAIVAFIIGDVWSKQGANTQDVGKVDGVVLTYRHFLELSEEAEDTYKRQQNVAQIKPEVENQLREQVWQNFVGETLTGKQYDQLGLTVSEAELNDMYYGTFIHPYLRQVFTDPQTGEYQVKAIRQYVDNFDKLDTAQRLEWIDLEEAVTADRRQQKYNTLLSQGMYMPTAIANQIAEMGSKVSNVYAINLPYQSVNDGDITLTEEDYAAYYEKHKSEYRIREELRELDYIVYPVLPSEEDIAKIAESVQKTWVEFQEEPASSLEFFVNAESDHSYDSAYRKASEFPAPMDSAILATPEGSFISPRIVGNEWMMAKVLKIENRPDSLRASTIYIFNERVGGNITRGDEQAKTLADSVMNILNSGAMTFEAAVRQFSDDPRDDGDGKWQLDGAYGFLNERILATPVGGIFLMQHPNELGYFIVKVTGKTTPNRKYRVAAIERAIVASEATSRAVYNAANIFAGNNRTYQEMAAAAQAENLQVRNGMVNSMSYTLGGIQNARSIMQWAFSDKTKVGEVADQVFQADDQYIVVALKDVYKQGYATLEQVRNMMENQVRIEKRAELLIARAEEARKTASDIASVAAKLNVAVDTLDSISFNDYFVGQYGMEPKLQAAIAAAPDNAFIGPIQGASGVYMVKINSRAQNPQAVPAEAIRSQMQQSYAQKMRGVMQVLKDNVKIIDSRYRFF